MAKLANLPALAFRASNATLLSSFRSGPCVHFVQLFVTQSNLPQPPKRPVTAYLDFVKKSWPQLAQDDPNMAANAKIKTIAAKWRDLDPREKEDYERSAQFRLVAYKEEVAKFQASLTDKQKEELLEAKREKTKRKAKIQQNRLLRQLEKPKRVRTPFIIFLKDKNVERGDAPAAPIRKGLFQSLFKRSEPVKEKEDLKMFTAGMGVKWKRMPEEDKQPFYDLAKADKERYFQEMKEWEDRMIAAGRPELVRGYHKAVPKPAKKKPAKKKAAAKKKTATKKKSTKSAVKTKSKKQDTSSSNSEE